MPRGQKNWNFFTFPHWFFVHFFTICQDVVEKVVYRKKIGGHWPFKSKLQAKLTQRLPAQYVLRKFSKRARSMHDVACHCDMNYVRSKDAQKQLLSAVCHSHIGGIDLLPQVFIPQPRPQANSRYPSERRRSERVLPTSFTGDFRTKLARDDWGRDCSFLTAQVCLNNRLSKFRYRINFDWF